MATITKASTITTSSGQRVSVDTIKKIIWADRTYIYLPEIIDVQIFNERVTKVFFSDGTTETTVCAPDDKFTLEEGITICIMKNILKSTKNATDGTRNYNKLIDKAIKTMLSNRKWKELKDKADQQAKEDKIKEEKRRAAKAEKRRKKRIAEIAEGIKLSQASNES